MASKSATPVFDLSSQLSSSQQQLIRQVLDRQSELKHSTDTELQHRVCDLKESVFQPASDADQITISALALSREAIHRVLGMQLYDVQLVAAHTLIQNKIAQMQTGEGKTISAAPAAVFGGLLGGGTHVATPNSYLAKRDFQQLRPVFELLGLSAGLLDPDAADDKKDAYACDITYGPGYEFGFDYLRDQLMLKKRDESALGTNLLDTLMNRNHATPTQIRGLQYSIIDEIDNVLVDDASSPQVLSEHQPGEASDSRCRVSGSPTVWPARIGTALL